MSQRHDDDRSQLLLDLQDNPERYAEAEGVPSTFLLKPWTSHGNWLKDRRLEARESLVEADLADLSEGRRQRLRELDRLLPTPLKERMAFAGAAAALWAVTLVVMFGDSIALLPIVARWAGSDLRSLFTEPAMFILATLLATGSIAVSLALAAERLIAAWQAQSARHETNNQEADLVDEFRRALPLQVATVGYLIAAAGIAYARVELDAQGTSLVGETMHQSASASTFIVSGFLAAAPLAGGYLLRASLAASARLRVAAAEVETLLAMARRDTQLIEEQQRLLDSIHSQRTAIRQQFDAAVARARRPELAEPAPLPEASPAQQFLTKRGVGTVLAQLLFLFLAIVLAIVFLAGCGQPHGPAAMELVVDASPGNLVGGTPVEAGTVTDAWHAFAEHTRLPEGTTLRVSVVASNIETTAVLEARAPRWPAGAAALEAKRRFVAETAEELSTLRFEDREASNVFGAVYAAARRLSENGAGTKLLVVLSDGRDLRAVGPGGPGWFFAREVPPLEFVLNQLDAEAELPNLSGVALLFCGVHGRGLLGHRNTASKDRALREVLRGYGAAGGARETRVFETCTAASFALVKGH